MIKRLLHVALAFITLIIVILPLSFGWFASEYDVIESSLSAQSIASYFASGDGTQSNPFIIATPKHLYNLSWLQNRGFIGADTPYGWRYFELNPEFYGDSTNELDMAGALNGEDTKTGAIPPIGTKENPFTGYFNGNGYTISNLWVSTDPDDWKEQPEEYQDEDYHYGVGLFGYCEKDENNPTYIGNFYLKNIEVTCSIHTDDLGLVAGYVDCSMSMIGVENGIFTFKNGYEVDSDYSIIGSITDEVIWTDNPIYGGSGAGGDLVISPTEDTNCAISNGKSLVPRSVMGNAYYVGSLQRVSPSPQPKGSYTYNSKLTFAATTIVANKSTCSTSTRSNSDESYMDLYNGSGTKYYMQPNSTPNFNAIDGFNTYPTNCVWFQPISGGTCCISFLNSSNKTSCFMSLYRYQRNADGSINTSTKQEMQFELTKDIGNGNVAYFEIELSDDEAKNYEYCIGRGSSGGNTDSGLFFLKLAGTDITHGTDPSDGTLKILNKIEFVNFNSLPVFTSPNYEIDLSGLKVTGTFTDGAKLQYHEFADGKVHYYNSTGSGLTITEQVAANFESQSDNNLSNYPTRDDE